MEEFIKSTHIAVENRPEPYGLFHLIFVITSILIIVAACYLMRKSSDRSFRIVLFATGVVLLLSEIYKQLYYLYAAGGEGYDWYIFPFQLCSVPMYLSIAVGLLKKSPIRDAICEYLASVGFLGGIMAYAEPSGILNEHYFTLIHSCIWHALLIFIALYILFTDNACRRFADYGKSVTVTAAVVLIATVLNIIFRDKQDFNMCYISPFYNTPLAVFSSFDTVLQGVFGDVVGRIISILIYIFALLLGGAIVYGACRLVKRAVAKKQMA